MPGIGDFSVTEPCGVARASNPALDTVGPALQWRHSHVARNKTVCICLADREDSIRKPAEPSALPIAKYTEVPPIIDPPTENT